VLTLPNVEPARPDAHAAPAVSRPGTLRLVPTAAVEPNPHQPRKVFDEEELAELAESIRAFGLLQPVVVRELEGDRFELVMGERRWRASRLAGLVEIPALVRDTEDSAMLVQALLENIQRVQLNPIEEAAAYQQMVTDLGATHEQVAAAVGKSRSHITHMISLLRLPPAVQRRVAAGVLSAGHAKVLVQLKDPFVCTRLAERIVAEGLSVRSTEELIALGDLPGAEGDEVKRERRRFAPPDNPWMSQLADRLGDRFDTRVRIIQGRTRGRIVVDYSDPEDLERILTLLAPDVVDQA